MAEAVAFGHPDAKYGEVVHAAVRLKEGYAHKLTAASLKAHCAKNLAAFKVSRGPI